MFRKYLQDTSGQFAMMFAISTVALIMGVAAAVDLTGIMKERAKLQAMTDAAVLAASTTKSENLADLKKAAEASIEGNLPAGSDIKIKVSLEGKIISVEGDSIYETQLMGAVGIGDWPVKAVSKSPIPKDIPLNIALVLDRTGSMEGANMDSLKSASAKLIEMFDGFDGEVRAAVVPFADYVNVGLGNRNATWMDVPADNTTTGTTETCRDTRDLVNSDLCYEETRTGTKDGTSYTYEANVCPDSAYGPVYETCSLPTTSTTWRGCAGSRADDRHKIPGYLNKKIPGVMDVWCGEEVLPLTLNITQVKDKINSLSSYGDTYIPAGLIWGWRMLDSAQPFDDLTNSQADRKRAMILMTDGENTRSLNQPKHNGTDSDAADALTAELCTDIKKQGIEMFTVAYRLSATAAKTKDMIRECATSDAYYFDASNTSELEQAFENIGRSLYEVRIIE